MQKKLSPFRETIQAASEPKVKSVRPWKSMLGNFKIAFKPKWIVVFYCMPYIYLSNLTIRCLSHKNVSASLRKKSRAGVWLKQQSIYSIRPDSGEEIDSEPSIVVSSNANSRCNSLNMTSFLQRKFNCLFNRFQDYILLHWDVRRGEKSMAFQDALFISITVLNLSGLWNLLARAFWFKMPIFKPIKQNILFALFDHWQEELVLKLTEQWIVPRLPK